MGRLVRNILTALCWLGYLWNGVAVADDCWLLRGVVEDYASRKPLEASLFVKTDAGRVRVGQSVKGTGQFAIRVGCDATTLIVERTGYRAQQLTLPQHPGGTDRQTVGLLIPLVAQVGAGSNRTYEQATQRHFEQQAQQEKIGQSQLAQFLVRDALMQTPLSAKVCFFATNGQPKRCLPTDAAGQLETTFGQRDIVAVEVRKSGYQPYQGNLVVEELDGKVHQHTLELLRELTLLSVQMPRSERPDARLMLRPTAGGTNVSLASVPGASGFWVAYRLQPGNYQLWRSDASGQPRKLRDLTLVGGLNRVDLESEKPTPATAKTASTVAETPLTNPTAASKRAYKLPEELPLLYFDQGSYLLDDEDRDLLRQVGVFMRAHPDYRLRLIGHTDPEGDERMNRYLAEFRAKMIANFLMWEGIDTSRLTTVGEGSRYPVSPSDIETNKAKNRRVFLKLERNE